MAIVTKPLPLPVWAESGEKVQPSNAEIAEGWPLSATPPSRQRFNWILGYSAQIGRYLMQNGIASWDADETYPPGAVVLHEGKLWVAQRENHGVPPGTSQADWGGSSGIIVDDSGNDLMTLIEQLREKDAALDAKDAALDAKDADLQAQIDQLKNSSGGGVSKIIAGAGISVNPASGTGDVTVSSAVSAPTTGGRVADIGAWRIIVGTGRTITGYKDLVTMPAELSSVFAIAVTEFNAEGWGPPGPNGEVTGAITIYGTTAHTDPDKFYVSGAKQAPGDSWKYSGGLGIQYIAIGENPDYVPPTPAP